MNGWIMRGIMAAALAAGVVAAAGAKEPTAEELFRQGIEASQQHQTDKAIALMQRVLKMKPRALNAYINLATLYGRDKKDIAKAEATIKQALLIAPTDYACEFEYVQVLIAQERYTEAKRVLLSARPNTSVERLEREKQLKELTKDINEAKTK